MTLLGPEIGSGFGEPDGKSLPRLLFYRNSKVFSFLKRDLACTDNSPPKKKPLFNVSNQDFLYHFKKAK